jgi:ribosomal protein L7Ae-like RNA K-turn-binding protein
MSEWQEYAGPPGSTVVVIANDADKDQLLQKIRSLKDEIEVKQMAIFQIEKILNEMGGCKNGKCV